MAMSRHHFVEHHTKRKQVSASIEFLSLHLFRRHIRHRANRRAWTRQVLLYIECRGSRLGSRNWFGSDLCQTEVEYLRVATLRYKDVRWLDTSR